MANDIMFRLVELEINPSTPKRARRKLQEILREYEFDEDFIENINEDTVLGFASAISIVKDIVREKENR